MFGLGTTEIIVILLVVFVIFGASRLPTVGRSLGAGLRNFQKSVTGKDDEPS
jgi:sec-independent protein translocase protein TatA